VSIRGTKLASGPITGTPVGGWYRYGGDKPLRTTEDRPLPGCEARTERREKRIAEFAAALADLGQPDPWKVKNPVVIEAGERVGVGRKTAMGYRTELRKRQPQGAEVHDD
jgi:hypothetical protein